MPTATSSQKDRRFVRTSNTERPRSRSARSPARLQLIIAHHANAHCIWNGFGGMYQHRSFGRRTYSAHHLDCHRISAWPERSERLPAASSVAHGCGIDALDPARSLIREYRCSNRSRCRWPSLQDHLLADGARSRGPVRCPAFADRSISVHLRHLHPHLRQHLYAAWDHRAAVLQLLPARARRPHSLCVPGCYGSCRTPDPSDPVHRSRRPP